MPVKRAGAGVASAQLGAAAASALMASRPPGRQSPLQMRRAADLDPSDWSLAFCAQWPHTSVHMLSSKGTELKPLSTVWALNEAAAAWLG